MSEGWKKIILLFCWWVNGNKHFIYLFTLSGKSDHCVCEGGGEGSKIFEFFIYVEYGRMSLLAFFELNLCWSTTNKEKKLSLYLDQDLL
jgi:hypothetical protein